MEQRQLAPTAAVAPDTIAPSQNFLHANEPDHQARLLIEDIELEITPTDELTGLPLPVLMSGSDYRSTDGPRISDYHHHFHPKKSPELGYDAAGRKLAKDTPERIEGFALRYSRGQDLPKWLHQRYHGIFSGPELPSDTRSKFTAVVLAAAGVVPREALDLSRPGEFARVSLDDKQHEFIRRRIYFEGAASAIKRSKRNSIGRFIADYALNNALEEAVSGREVKHKINEFLKPKSENEKVMAGRFILTRVIDASIAELIPVHQEAIKEKMVRRQRDLGRTITRFFTADRFQDYFVPLEDRLATSVI